MVTRYSSAGCHSNLQESVSPPPVTAQAPANHKDTQPEDALQECAFSWQPVPPTWKVEYHEGRLTVFSCSKSGDTITLRPVRDLEVRQRVDGHGREILQYRGIPLSKRVASTHPSDVIPSTALDAFDSLASCASLSQVDPCSVRKLPDGRLLGMAGSTSVVAWDKLDLSINTLWASRQAWKEPPATLPTLVSPVPIAPAEPQLSKPIVDFLWAPELRQEDLPRQADPVSAVSLARDKQERTLAAQALSNVAGTSQLSSWLTTLAKNLSSVRPESLPGILEALATFAAGLANSASVQVRPAMDCAVDARLNLCREAFRSRDLQLEVFPEGPQLCLADQPPASHVSPSRQHHPQRQMTPCSYHPDHHVHHPNKILLHSLHKRSNRKPCSHSSHTRALPRRSVRVNQITNRKSCNGLCQALTCSLRVCLTRIDSLESTNSLATSAYESAGSLALSSLKQALKKA